MMVRAGAGVPCSGGKPPAEMPPPGCGDTVPPACVVTAVAPSGTNGFGCGPAGNAAACGALANVDGASTLVGRTRA